LDSGFRIKNPQSQIRNLKYLRWNRKQKTWCVESSGFFISRRPKSFNRGDRKDIKPSPQRI